ncbi:hypothetical protein [Streptomyces sp. NPDC029674]|uniref:hypothetical protein n=1 Tax=Streptomyces sp. NPDC029674 TaxID=3365297 RepID=UPI00384EB93A
MRQRLTTVLGGLAMAGTLVLTGPLSAQAATGDLIINNEHHQNPSGCYPTPGQASIQNHTDAPVTLYLDSQCSGPSAGTVSPGGKATLSPVFSVSIS